MIDELDLFNFGAQLESVEKSSPSNSFHLHNLLWFSDNFRIVSDT